jgi:hypothetical protein
MPKKSPYSRKGVPCATGDPLVQRGGKMYIIAKGPNDIDIPVPCTMKTMTGDGKLLVKAGKNVSIEIDPITKKVYRVLVAGDLVNDGSTLVVPKAPDLKSPKLVHEVSTVMSSKAKAAQYILILTHFMVRLSKVIKKTYRNYENLMKYERTVKERVQTLDDIDPTQTKGLFQGKPYRKITPYRTNPMSGGWNSRNAATAGDPKTPRIEPRQGKTVPTDIAATITGMPTEENLLYIGQKMSAATADEYRTGLVELRTRLGQGGNTGPRSQARRAWSAPTRSSDTSGSAPSTKPGTTATVPSISATLATGDLGPRVGDDEDIPALGAIGALDPGVLQTLT